MTTTLDFAAYGLGCALMVLFALALISAIVYILAGLIEELLFTRMRSIYHLSSIAYWLHHYEKRGRKCFLTPDEGQQP